MTIEEQIRQHEERITEAISHRYAGCCPHCHANEKFHRHEIRRRNFYYVGEDGQSLAVRSLFARGLFAGAVETVVCDSLTTHRSRCVLSDT
jgi:hypothetical protein